MNIIRVFKRKIIVLKKPSNMSYRDFRRQYNVSLNGEFREIELPYSEFGFYKLDENGKVIVDAERTLEKKAEIQKEFFTKKIKEKIDQQAQQLRFDNLYNAGVYQTTEDNPLKASANALGAWAGNVWGAVISIEQQVKNGDMEAPTSWEELEALLPPFSFG